MSHELHVVIERDEDGWLVGTIPGLPGCHTQARSLDELMGRMQEAAEAYLDVRGQEFVVNEFVGVQRLTVEA
jgi:predicted RNase H-like HicB family nuclease